VASDLLHTIVSNAWVLFLVILLFGGSIFVHELGHFLLARWRGAHVERFSIGFGPALWSRRGNDGVEYRISWIPVGGYVLLPQLADLSLVEGESRVDATKLPPVNYATKMIVFAAGAAFNVLFAFVLACFVSLAGLPSDADPSTTTVAEVLPTLKTADGAEVPSPASRAGLKSGDVILAVDGQRVTTFDDIVEQLTFSSGWKAGQRRTVFTVRRGEATLDLAMEPVISGTEKTRKVGFTPYAKIVVGQVAPGSLAAQAGLQTDDQITRVDGQAILTRQQFAERMNARTKPVKLTVLRKDHPLEIVLGAPLPGQNPLDFGMGLKTEVVHPNPFTQVADAAVHSVINVWALINPKSDIGIRHMSGPVGIIGGFVDVSRAGLPIALWFTIIVNVNLAIVNLLPIPVLDGGQMLFATIARLRGRALPATFIMAAQSVFFVLIFAFIGYISVFIDVPRLRREHAEEVEATSPKKANPPAATPTTQPTPTK
jgi:regulator of sigma E protease